MKRILLTVSAIVTLTLASGQNMTDVSLQRKDSDNQEKIIESESGDLYKKLNHHGPAVENEWLGLRLYFDYKCAIDVYNKTKPGLELEGAGWYPTTEQQKEGWGADQYKVGQTVGLGGVRLWDGEKVQFLNPVKMRTARVRKEANFSQMEMLSEAVPYKGDYVDILVRVTVFSGMREAKIESFALCDIPVEFVTGVNYWPDTETTEGENYMGTWGIHPEDVAAFQLEIGAGLIYNPEDFARKEKTDKEMLLISKPTKYISTWVTTACEKEKKIKNQKRFFKYLAEKAQ